MPTAYKHKKKMTPHIANFLWLRPGVPSRKKLKNAYFCNQTYPTMRRLLLILFLFPLGLISCKNSESAVSRIQSRQLEINHSIPADPQIEAFIAPYREHIAEEMDSVLAFAPRDLDKTHGDLNTAIGNMMADAVMELAGPVFEKRTGKTLDIVLLNFGGIRSTINQGEVTTRTAYQVMPFENEVVIAELKGVHLQDMIDYLIEANTAHPIAGMELWIDDQGKVLKALVQGESIQKDRSYFIATNDYLFLGGDNMNFFSHSISETPMDYKIRNLLIDYFRKKDSIAPVIDQRFIRK